MSGRSVGGGVVRKWNVERDRAAVGRRRIGDGTEEGTGVGGGEGQDRVVWWRVKGGGGLRLKIWGRKGGG